MTLFATAFKDENNIFVQALSKCCAGQKDEYTLALLF
jgi:uncharacterized protein (DUF1810 family)